MDRRQFLIGTMSIPSLAMMDIPAYSPDLKEIAKGWRLELRSPDNELIAWAPLGEMITIGPAVKLLEDFTFHIEGRSATVAAIIIADESGEKLAECGLTYSAYMQDGDTLEVTDITLSSTAA